MLAAVLVLADVDGAAGMGDLRRGTFTFASGAVYVGEYQDSKQHGGSFALSFYVADKQSGESVWFSQGSLEGLAMPGVWSKSRHGTRAPRTSRCCSWNWAVRIMPRCFRRRAMIVGF